MSVCLSFNPFVCTVHLLIYLLVCCLGAPTSAPVFTTKIPTQLKPFTNTNVTAEINKSFEFPELCAAANGRHRPKWAKYVVDKSKYRYFPFDNTKRIHAVGNGLLGVALVFDVVKKKDEHEYKCLLLDHSHRVVEVAAVELRVSGENDLVTSICL